MKRLLRMTMGLALLAATVAAGVWAFRPQPHAVDLAAIRRGRLRVTVDEDGKTRIRERYIVSAPLAGMLLRIDLEPGDAVKASKTLLATIQPRDPELLDPRAILQAEARVGAASAALRRASTALEQAKLDQTDAERDLERVRTLQKQGAVSESQMDNAQLRFESAGEQLRAAHYAQDIASFELQQAEAALLRSRPQNANGPEEESEGSANSATDSLPASPPAAPFNFLIHSPIDGRVLRVFQESAAVIPAGTDLLELGDPRDLETVVDVLSQDAVKIRPDQNVLLEHWGGARPLRGRVRLVEPAAYTKISTLGVEEQRVDVVIDLIEPPTQREALGDGFRVEARIIVWEQDDVLIVPTSALFRDGEDWAVFRVVSGRAQPTSVQIGQQNGLEAQLLGGLDVGDQVIMHPSDVIEEGVRVAPRQ